MVNVSSESREIMITREIMIDHCDHNKFKLHASIRWLFSFIPLYHKDKVKNNVRNNLDFLSLPPKTIAGNAVWRDIIALLVSCEAYRCASLTIFGPPAPLNHWQVIQTLARHGFYVVTEDGTGVIQTALLTANPFNKTSHLAMIDCLMQAYACRLVTIPRVVAVVKKIGPFNPSQELPYDLEDSLVLWINKVCHKVKKGLNDAVTTKQENLKLGLVHPSVTYLPPAIPYMEDLVQDIGDGQCLGVLVHYYLPTDLPLDALKFGSTLPQSDKAANLGAVRFTVMTVLSAPWFPLSIQMFLNPSFSAKANVIAFVSELFWKFEVNGMSRNEFSSDRWLKEEERSGDGDMNCAAAATEISQQLEKCPVSLEPVTGRIGRKVSSESSGDDVDLPPPLSRSLRPHEDSPAEKVIPVISSREIKYPGGGHGEVSEEEQDSAISSEADDTALPTNKYFADAGGLSGLILSTIHTGPTKSSQSLGSLDKMISDPNEESAVTMTRGIQGTGPTPQSLRQLHDETENAHSSSETDSASDGEGIEVKKESRVQAAYQETPLNAPEQRSEPSIVSKSLPCRPRAVRRQHQRRKSGEEIVAEMKMAEEEKREFYMNIAKWVDSVEKECKVKPISASELTANISKTIETHFSKTPQPTVGVSYTISKEDKEEAAKRGLPVIGPFPVTPAPAPPQKIKGDYLLTVQERDDTIRKQQEEEERLKQEELDRKRQLEEKLAEEKRLLEEISDSSNKSVGSKKGKKGAKGAAAKKGGKGVAKEGKSFPRRPGSVGSNSSAASSKSGKGKGTTGKGKKGKTKDDMSVKSEKISRSKSGRVDQAGGAKRRVKSARRAGKSVSFIDEKAESEVAEVPAMDLIPKEDIPPTVECPFKKDTQVIGDDRTDKQKVAYFVPLEDAAVGLGSGPINKRPVSGSGWPADHDSVEDSLLAVRNTDSEIEVTDSSSSEESDNEQDKISSPTEQTINRLDFTHILNSLQPQYGSEPVFVFERRDDYRKPLTPMPSDPKQLVIHLQMQAKRKNIEKFRHDIQHRWEEERSVLNRHVFYEALKKTRDIGEQANSEDIRAEIERSDSLEELLVRPPGSRGEEPFNPRQAHPTGAAPSSVRPPTLMEKVIDETGVIFSPVVDEEYETELEDTTKPNDTSTTPEKPPSVPSPTSDHPSTILPKSEVSLNQKTDSESSSSELVAVFSNHEEFLSTKFSVSDDPSSSPAASSRKPTAMQYFYGFSDVVSDDKISQKRQQFFVAQKKKQEELNARRELEQQRKLEQARLQSHFDGELRRQEGNLVTKCARAKSSRVRVVRREEKMLPAPRPMSAAPVRTTLMSCRTPDPCQTTRPTPEPSAPRGSSFREDRGHMYPDKNKLIGNGGVTYRKHSTDRSPNVNNHNIKNNHLTEKLKNSPKSSPRPPALPLFVPPSAKSNSKVISNAVCWTCLSGVPDRPQQQQALKAIANNPSQQYVILFRDYTAKKFRGIYTFDNASSKLIRIFGKGPKTILLSMLSHLYKYDSGSRAFSDLPTMTFSLSVDGITIKNELWRKAGVFPC